MTKPRSRRRRKYAGCTCECGEPLAAGTTSHSKLAKAPKTSKRSKRPRAVEARQAFEGAEEYCVFSRKGKIVRCFQKEAVAKRVAQGFGPGFSVRPSGRRNRKFHNRKKAR